jgi:hypothetical protein
LFHNLVIVDIGFRMIRKINYGDFIWWNWFIPIYSSKNDFPTCIYRSLLIGRFSLHTP